jgi:hypothetical protein
MEGAISKVFEAALTKRSQGLPLTALEFAGVAGMNYAKARTLFYKTPGFPLFEGKVYWSDFEIWRRNQIGLVGNSPAPAIAPNPEDPSEGRFRASDHSNDSQAPLPARAARLFARAA